MGREPFTKAIELIKLEVKENGAGTQEIRTKEVKDIEFFTWEKTDYVEKVKVAFSL